ncbi:MAG: hypothetical protein E7379_03270 [Clostridiales bacterium]|nr:hypothetical protein [Clostridiales bacterium]
MITKQLRNNKEGYYDVKITDKNGKSFVMTVGGNLDLYWLPENHKENKIFEIDKSDKITYGVFNQLFNAVGKNDDKYRPVLQGNIISYISEDWPEDEANVLNIIKTEDAFTIKFIKNEDKESWSYPHMGCAICFCNSGSRVPKVEQVFMQLFNYLAYESKLIECEPLEDEKIK